MTFKVLIIEDNHSFIDSMKVMLRDLQLDFVQAFRFSDALQTIENSGVFYNRPKIESAANVAGAEAEGVSAAPVKNTAKSRSAAKPAPLYNDGGVFLVIVEQNTESSMKGTDFIAHVTKKYPGLVEADFILLTHRLELVPAKSYGFPVLEKPLRQPQIRQIVSQKLKQAQDTVEMQIRLSVQNIDAEEVPPAESKKPKRKGFRDFIKSKLKGDEMTETASDVKKPVKKVRKTAVKTAQPEKSTRKAPVKKAKPK